MITCFLVEMKLSDWKVHWRIAQFVISRTTGILFCWYGTISGSVNVFVSVKWAYGWVGILNAMVMLSNCSRSFKIQHVKILNQLSLNWHLNVSYWATYILLCQVSIIQTRFSHSLGRITINESRFPCARNSLTLYFQKRFQSWQTAQEGIHPPECNNTFLNQFECILQRFFEFV